MIIISTPTINALHTYVCSCANLYVYLIKIRSVSPVGEVPSTTAAFPFWMATAIL